jgi:hypothetical protein
VSDEIETGRLGLTSWRNMMLVMKFISMSNIFLGYIIVLIYRYQTISIPYRPSARNKKMTPLLHVHTDGILMCSYLC